MLVSEMIRRLLLLAVKLLLCCVVLAVAPINDRASSVQSAVRGILIIPAQLSSSSPNTVRVLDSLLPPLHQSYGQFPMRVLDQWTGPPWYTTSHTTKWESSWGVGRLDRTGQDDISKLYFTSVGLYSLLYLSNCQPSSTNNQILPSISIVIVPYLSIGNTRYKSGFLLQKKKKL